VIQVTRLNETTFHLNAEFILSVESTPDTVITLTSREKIIVKETEQTIVDRIINYRKQTNRNKPLEKEL